MFLELVISSQDEIGSFSIPPSEMGHGEEDVAAQFGH
jgi:hypothetical protein